MNALRLSDGAPAALFEQRTGLPLASLEQARREAEARQLLQNDPQRLVATREGQRCSSTICCSTSCPEPQRAPALGSSVDRR